MAVLVECPSCHRKQNARAKKCANAKCSQDLDKAKKANKAKFWISYYLPGGKGKQRREAVGFSIKEAQDAEGKRRGQKRENRIFDIKPDAKMTFQKLTEWYLDLEKIKALAYYDIMGLYLKKFNSEFGDMIVNQIKPADLENLQAKRKGQGKADATVDQEIGAARAMINKAFDNGLIGGETLRAFKKVKKLLKRNANARDTVLTPEQFRELLACKDLPAHTRGIVAMAFYTGMRKGEIVSLTWPQVDMKNRLIRLEAKDTKDKEPRAVPIGEELYGIMRTIPRALHDNHVFLFRGKPVRDIRGGLKKACEATGISYGRFTKGGFVLHDQRHGFTTYMSKAGVAESVIMRMTGHSTREMFDRYNRVDQDDMKAAMVKMQTLLTTSDQTSDQEAK